MQIVELSKGSKFALALTMSPADVAAFADEMRNAKQALLEWKSKRGTRCDKVMFTVVCDAEHHNAIEDAIQQIYHNETQLAPLLQSVDVDVALLKPRGKTATKEYLLKRTGSGRKPWWKFW